MDLLEAIEWLRKGEPVAMPTETVYGLAASVFNESAIKKIFEIKGRPLDNPLIAHVANWEQVGLLTGEIGADFQRLGRAFWPGPLTLVVKRRPEIPAMVSAGHPTIAIRMPKHPIALKMIEAVGPLVAPSANLSGRPSPTSLRDVMDDLGDRFKGGVDGGDCEIGIESTVLSLVHEMPTILRPGAVTAEMLETVLGKKVMASGAGPAIAPGMKYRHYAPNANVKLLYIQSEIKGPYLIPNAKTLYAELRDADRKGLAEVQFYCDEAVQKDAALMNRLLKAASK
jgi:L-threonylcarbamoyladenylate synthase